MLRLQRVWLIRKSPCYVCECVMRRLERRPCRMQRLQKCFLHTSSCRFSGRPLGSSSSSTSSSFPTSTTPSTPIDAKVKIVTAVSLPVPVPPCGRRQPPLPKTNNKKRMRPLSTPRTWSCAWRRRRRRSRRAASPRRRWRHSARCRRACSAGRPPSAASAPGVAGSCRQLCYAQIGGVIS